MTGKEYHQYKDYGNDDPREEDPYFYCAIGDQLYKGNSNYGPGTEPCRQYLKQRCSTKWDEVCDYYSKHQGHLAPDDYSHMDKDKVPEGDQFIRMVGEEKFCRTVGMRGPVVSREEAAMWQSIPDR